MSRPPLPPEATRAVPAGRIAAAVLASLASLALLAPAAARAAAQDAVALLSRVEKTYRASPSYSMTFVQSYAPAGFPDAAPETGALTLQAPASLRFKYDGPEGKLYTFDGQTARQYVAVDKQLIVKRLGASERARLPLLFLQSPAEILARHVASVADGPNGLAELTLVPKDGGSPRASPPRSRPPERSSGSSCSTERGTGRPSPSPP